MTIAIARMSCAPVTMALSLALFAAPAAAATEDPNLPKWTGHSIFYETTAERTVIYGVGAHAVGNPCSALMSTVAVDIAAAGGNSAIAKYLGKASGRTTHSLAVRSKVTEVQSGDEAPPSRVRVDEINVGTSATVATRDGIPGVTTVGAYFDSASGTLYVLSAKVIDPARVPLAGLLPGSPKGGQSIGEARRTMSQTCKR